MLGILSERAKWTCNVELWGLRKGSKGFVLAVSESFVATVWLTYMRYVVLLYAKFSVV